MRIGIRDSASGRSYGQVCSYPVVWLHEKYRELISILCAFQRLIVLCYGTLVGSGLIFFTLSSFVQDLPRRALPYKGWFPFDCYESLLGYSTAYAMQMIAFGSGCAIDVAFDTLLPGLMLQTCAQLNILKQRFHGIQRSSLDHGRDLPKEDESKLSASTLESKMLSESVEHHIEIFKLETSLSSIVFILFACCNCFVLLRLEKKMQVREDIQRPLWTHDIPPVRGQYCGALLELAQALEVESPKPGIHSGDFLHNGHVHPVISLLLLRMPGHPGGKQRMQLFFRRLRKSLALLFARNYNLFGGKLQISIHLIWINAIIDWNK